MADHFYKRNADQALAGMMGLSLEEKGAYNTIIDLIYSTTNRLRDDERYMCGWLQCDVRVWKRIRARLIELEKISIEDGFIRNRRASNEIAERSTSKSGVYPQNGPQPPKNDQAVMNFPATSGELRGASSQQVPRTYGAKSGAQLNKQNAVNPPASRAPASRVENIDKPLTPFERPADGDLKDYENLVRFAGWLLGRTQLQMSEQSVLTEWISAGYDLNAMRPSLERSVEKYREKNQGQRPKSLAYFSPMLDDLHHKRGRAR